MNEIEPKDDTPFALRLADAEVLWRDILRMPAEREKPIEATPIRCFAVWNTDQAEAAIMKSFSVKRGPSRLLV